LQHLTVVTQLRAFLVWCSSCHSTRNRWSFFSLFFEKFWITKWLNYLPADCSKCPVATNL